VEEEIAGSLDRMQKQGIHTARFFAYPNGSTGDYTSRHIEILRKLSFRCAVASDPGSVTERASLFTLPRYEGKNDVDRFICHASGMQSLLSRAKRFLNLGSGSNQ
jgi:hypothetical protein